VTIPLPPETARTRRPRSLANTWRVLRTILIGVLFVVGITLILLFPILPARSPYDLQVGEVALEDIRAPRQVTYTSTIETEAARTAARDAVPDIYDPADARIGRQQVRRARQIMDFVADVRADSLASTDLKQDYLDAIVGLTVPPETRHTLLTLNQNQFEQVEREVVALIEESMSGTLREGRVEEVTGRLELSISADLPEDLIPVTVALARDLIIANSALNEASTEETRAQAAAAVEEIEHTFQPGEIVIRAGDSIDELDREALVALGLASQGFTWRNATSATLISILSLVIFVVYMVAFNPAWMTRTRYLLVVTLLFLFFLAAAQIMIPGKIIVAYLFPAAALALVLAALLGLEFTLLAMMILSWLVGYVAQGSLEIAAFTAVSGLLAAGSLQRDAKLNSYFLSGIFAAIGGMVVLLIFRLPTQTDSIRLAQLLFVSLLNGFFSAGISLVLLFVIGNITGITTSIQLIDLMRPDHPLQRLMQREALGSYQHTLSVANLVEAAAEVIGANTLLARVGTLYHDAGKAANPGFFIENRADNQPNPHEGLSPLASARIIRAHVQDGIRLARKHRVPSQIIAFIPEHHGTTSISFFLNVAREQAQAQGVHLDQNEFFYEGPIPQSRESAILMLADGCESAVRANRPSTEEEIEGIVSRIIQQRIDQHQLDESGLTLTDIQRVKDSFVRTLRGMYHPRVKYPGDEKPKLLESAGSPAPPLPRTELPQFTEADESNDRHQAAALDAPDIEIRPDQPSSSS
jgi:cyclic-di-AMP phosphodiesterase PgpH